MSYLPSSASVTLSTAAEKQVLQVFTAPYKRVSGLYGNFTELPLSAFAASSASSSNSSHSASASSAPSFSTSFASSHSKSSNVSVPPPSAVTSSSFEELSRARAMNVPPLYGPRERYPEPQTNRQEIGWRVGEAARWKELASAAADAAERGDRSGLLLPTPTASSRRGVAVEPEAEKKARDRNRRGGGGGEASSGGLSVSGSAIGGGGR